MSSHRVQAPRGRHTQLHPDSLSLILLSRPSFIAFQFYITLIPNLFSYLSVFAFLLFHVSLSPLCEDISLPSRRFPGRHHSFPRALSLSNSHPAKEQFEHVDMRSPFNQDTKHFYMLRCFDVTRQLELCENL